jgi:hypothetical protein
LNFCRTVAVCNGRKKGLAHTARQRSPISLVRGVSRKKNEVVTTQKKGEIVTIRSRRRVVQKLATDLTISTT